MNENIAKNKDVHNHYQLTPKYTKYNWKQLKLKQHQQPINQKAIDR